MSQTLSPQNDRVVAVTGMGCICAAGQGLDEVWQALEAKDPVPCGSVPPWLFPTQLSFPVFAAPADPLSPDGRRLIGPASRSRPLANRTALLAISAVASALAQAGLEAGQLRGHRVGIAVGTTVGCTFNDEDYYAAWRRGLSPAPEPVERFLAGNLAALLHSFLGTTGPAAVITNACASGTDAIGIARQWLLAGLCDLAIAGGADELSRIALNGFASLMLTAASPCQPFDQRRAGLNLGEGAGVLIMERQETAAARGAELRGLVRGYGTAADAWHPTAPHPEGRGLKTAFNAALADAGLTRDDISLINAHGTGTPANDLVEATAIAAIFGNDQVPPMVSTKGLTGHTLGAAGGLEAILTFLALDAGFTPGTVGCLNPDPLFPLQPLAQGSSAKLSGRIGVSQSLAFGGGNSVLVLESLP